LRYTFAQTAEARHRTYLEISFFNTHAALHLAIIPTCRVLGVAVRLLPLGEMVGVCRDSVRNVATKGRSASSSSVSTALFEHERSHKTVDTRLQFFQPSRPEFFFSILPVPLSVVALTRESFTLSPSDIAAFRTVMGEHFYLTPRSWASKLQHYTLELTWRRLLQSHSRHFDPGGIPCSPDTSIHTHSEDPGSCELIGDTDV
jgi:hypothetical protein